MAMENLLRRRSDRLILGLLACAVVANLLMTLGISRVASKVGDAISESDLRDACRQRGYFPMGGLK